MVAQDDIADAADEAYRSRAGYGAPDWQLDAWVSTYTAIGAGDAIERLSPGARLLRSPEVVRAARTG